MFYSVRNIPSVYEPHSYSRLVLVSKIPGNSSCGEKKEKASYKNRVDDFILPLVKFVDRLISAQDEMFKNLIEKEEENKESIEQFESKGLLSVDNVSQRIVDYAKRIPKEYNPTYFKIRASIEKGFAEAEKRQGNLSAPSKNTKEAIIKKLEDKK